MFVVCEIAPPAPVTPSTMPIQKTPWLCTNAPHAIQQVNLRPPSACLSRSRRPPIALWRTHPLRHRPRSLRLQLLQRLSLIKLHHPPLLEISHLPTPKTHNQPKHPPFHSSHPIAQSFSTPTPSTQKQQNGFRIHVPNSWRNPVPRPRFRGRNAPLRR